MKTKSRTFTHMPGLVALAAAGLVSGPVSAEVGLRVESRPITGPIEAFVSVADAGGSALGLTGGDFAITLDGQSVKDFGFRLPLNQDPTQRLSVVFVQADSRAMSSAGPFISRMAVGDFAAIVRARYLPGDPTPMLKLQPFTQIDDGAGTQSLIEFLALSIYERAILRYGSMVPHVASLSLALEQLELPPAHLPAGPHAVILLGNGRYVDSIAGHVQSDVVARANAIGVPVFTIGTDRFDTRPDAAAFMASVAEDTGGRYFGAFLSMSIEDSYETIESLLADAYQVVIPAGIAADCEPHLLEVTVRGETSSAPFVRCDTTPNPLVFEEQVQVAIGSTVVSNAVAITSIESPVPISVRGGEYSLGCRTAFTAAPGTAQPEELVCVRHIASAQPVTTTETVLIIGGVAASFISSTDVGLTSPSPPPPSPPPLPPGGGSQGAESGGGGAAGILELLLAFGALLFRRTRMPRGTKYRLDEPSPLQG